MDGAADDTESTSLATRSSSSILEVMGGRNNLHPMENGHLLPREGLRSTSTIALVVDSETASRTSTIDRLGAFSRDSGETEAD